MYFNEDFLKIWPRLGYKRKKILLFHSFWVTCKISLVPGTGLEPALLSEHAPETCASTNSATRAGSIPSLGMNLSDLCPGQDLNLHRLWRLPPQSSVSTNSTTWAFLIENWELKIEKYFFSHPSFSLESGCKSTNIFRTGKTFFNGKRKIENWKLTVSLLGL